MSVIPASFKFTGEHYERLQIALFAAYPVRDQLEQLTYFKLELDLDTVAAATVPMPKTVFELIKWAKACGRVSDLINVAYAKTPNNPELRDFVQMLTGGVLVSPAPIVSLPPPRPAYELAQVSDFDLSVLVPTAFNALMGKRGVVGLAIPCEDAIFLTHFCARLRSKLEKARLGKIRVEQRDVLFLRPSLANVEEGVAILKRYRSLLKKQDVLCPIQVDVSDKAKADEMAAQFWQAVLAAFPDLTTFRLILVLVGSCSMTFPAAVQRLPELTFQQTDISEYVSTVISALEWDGAIAETWYETMLLDCAANGVFKIRYVYDHLAEALACLRDGATVESFQAFLQERKQAYA